MNKKIAIVTGGYSGEAVISYKSVQTIFSNLDRERFDCYVIDINPQGWFYVKSAEDLTHICTVDKNEFTIVDNGEKIFFDLVLIAMHGTPGEDGKLQGYFDCLNIPYTSCNAATSSITFNKRYTTAIAGASGISVAKSLLLFKGESFDVHQIHATLSLPVFVKPNNGGSSIGMSKVTKVEDLDAAIHKAFKEDDQVLIEAFIPGRELTIGVFKHGDEIITLPMTEIITKNDFFDFQAKYEGASEEITPAVVDEKIAEKVRTSARKVYHVLNCSGIVRIDFIYHEAQQTPFMLEINTVPGQSAASIVPQQVAAMGWSLKQFYTALIESGLNSKIIS